MGSLISLSNARLEGIQDHFAYSNTCPVGENFELRACAVKWTRTILHGSSFVIVSSPEIPGRAGELLRMARFSI